MDCCGSPNHGNNYPLNRGVVLIGFRLLQCSQSGAQGQRSTGTPVHGRLAGSSVYLPATEMHGFTPRNWHVARTMRSTEAYRCKLLLRSHS